MIDVEPPSTLTGIALLVLLVFVVGSIIITSGLWPIAIAIVGGAVVLYLAVKLLKGADRRVQHIFTGGRRR